MSCGTPLTLSLSLSRKITSLSGLTKEQNVATVCTAPLLAIDSQSRPISPATSANAPRSNNGAPSGVAGRGGAATDPERGAAPHAEAHSTMGNTKTSAKEGKPGARSPLASASSTVARADASSAVSAVSRGENASRHRSKARARSVGGSGASAYSIPPRSNKRRGPTYKGVEALEHVAVDGPRPVRPPLDGDGRVQTVARPLAAPVREPRGDGERPGDGHRHQAAGAAARSRRRGRRTPRARRASARGAPATARRASGPSRRPRARAPRF